MNLLYCTDCGGFKIVSFSRCFCLMQVSVFLVPDRWKVSWQSPPPLFSLQRQKSPSASFSLSLSIPHTFPYPQSGWNSLPGLLGGQSRQKLFASLLLLSQRCRRLRLSPPAMLGKRGGGRSHVFWQGGREIARRKKGKQKVSSLERRGQQTGGGFHEADRLHS